MQEREEMTTGIYVHEILKELFKKVRTVLQIPQRQLPKRTVQLGKVHILNHKLIKFAKTNELKSQKALRK